MLEKIRQPADFIISKTTIRPEVGIILGTGLGGLVDEIEQQEVLNYSDIPNFPGSTVSGHSGRLILGVLGGKRVVAMQGSITRSIYIWGQGLEAQTVVDRCHDITSFGEIMSHLRITQVLLVAIIESAAVDKQQQGPA